VKVFPSMKNEKLKVVSHTTPNYKSHKIQAKLGNENKIVITLNPNTQKCSVPKRRAILNSQTFRTTFTLSNAKDAN
jgi:hypothetical protein